MQLLRRLAQIVLGLALGYAGVGHLGANRVEFQAQVTSVFKGYADFIVVWALWCTGTWRARKAKPCDCRARCLTGRCNLRVMQLA
jgi:hypothetical protein